MEIKREEIFEYAREKYESNPEYLWKKYPTYAVLRRNDNKKWFAAVMNVPKSVLGLSGDESVEIVDIKCGKMMSGSLRLQEGILKGYHMNKENWVSVLLDGTVDRKTVFSLIDLSFDLTKK